ncbi:MAG: hypothetical protein EXS49_01580 [Candidatus Pacebacteria bacterium]|nr:hypothetical protein [Candidatus Paceibacterota bacterium]
MVSIFIYKILENKQIISLLYPIFGEKKNDNQLYNTSAFKYFDKPFFKVVDKIQDADFILIPHLYKSLEDSYIKEAESFSKINNKILLIYAYGDLDQKIKVKNAIVMKYSGYRHSMKPWELVIPPNAADASLETSIIYRNKTNTIPIIGFCGWADSKNISDKIKLFIRNLYIEIKSILSLNQKINASKKGIYFRKKSIKYLQSSSLVKTSFIIRKSFSMHRKTISLDPEIARREFLENIKSSDLMLDVRGDGNASTRFYEALSLGRIPIVIDTELILPLEDVIPYRDFCLFVPFSDIKNLPQIVHKYYESMSVDDFMKKQKLAREMFEKYLRSDKFYSFIFSSKEEILKRATPST